MPIEVTRNITTFAERELWTRAAGRCQFDGCNRILFKSPITQERVNISEKAHIYSFAESGPRGWGPFKLNKKLLNDRTAFYGDKFTVKVKYIPQAVTGLHLPGICIRLR